MHQFLISSEHFNSLQYTTAMTTSPDADGLDAVLCRVNLAFLRSDNHLINVLMIKLLLAVRIIPRVTLITAQTQTYTQQQQQTHTLHTIRLIH